jgi:hypothetical protein
MPEAINSTQQWASKGLEAWCLYMDANLQISQRLTDFAVNAAKEAMSLYAEVQAANIEAVQEGQTYAIQRLREVPEAVQNPRSLYQRNMQDFSSSAEKVCKLVQNNAQAVLRSSEQYWLTAQHTGHSIQNTYTQLYEKLTALYTPDAETR